MFYIQQDNKIVLFDEDKQRLQNTIAFTTPQFQGLEIKEVEEGYIIYNFELMTIEEMTEKQAQARAKEFYNTFLATSKGNYRLQPKGYANAQQSIDTINNMVNALGSLTNQISEMILFYETPDFTDETQCTEEWLIAHQYKAEPMTKEEWTEFYIEFSTLYAQKQYK